MALVTCTGCGHTISSFARFCPKCNLPKNGPAPEQSPQNTGFTFPAFETEQQPLRSDHFNQSSSARELLLQHEFEPALDEKIVLKGQVFIVGGLFSIREGYAYLTSQRYAVCDASGVNIEFQTALNGISAVEEGRHLISRKIIISTTTGETCHIKGLPHSPWFQALHEAMTSRGSELNSSTAVPESSSASVDWHYESNGMKIGPVREQLIVQLIKNNHTVFRTTKVWNQSLPDWKPAEDTILTIYFSENSEPLSRDSDSGSQANRFPQSIFSRIKMLCRKYF